MSLNTPKRETLQERTIFISRAEAATRVKLQKSRVASCYFQVASNLQRRNRYSRHVKAIILRLEVERWSCILDAASR